MTSQMGIVTLAPREVARTSDCPLFQENPELLNFCTLLVQLFSSSVLSGSGFFGRASSGGGGGVTGCSAGALVDAGGGADGEAGGAWVGVDG